MPLASIPAQMFFKYKGVSVYHVYKEDDPTEGYIDYGFAFEAGACFAYRSEWFDVDEVDKDLREHGVEIDRKKYKDSMDYAKNVIIAALNKELIEGAPLFSPDKNEQELVEAFACPKCGCTEFRAYFLVNAAVRLFPEKYKGKIEVNHDEPFDYDNLDLDDDTYTCANCREEYDVYTLRKTRGE